MFGDPTCDSSENVLDIKSMIQKLHFQNFLDNKIRVTFSTESDYFSLMNELNRSAKPVLRKATRLFLTAASKARN